jgi:hypothetical protein
MIVRREKAQSAQRSETPYPASVRRAFFMATALKELSSFGLRFVADDSGKIIAAAISRPNGVVTAKRKGAVRSNSE